jgi:hypothetical protein
MEDMRSRPMMYSRQLASLSGCQPKGVTGDNVLQPSS